MRGSLLAVLSALFVILAPCAQAAEPAADVKGVYLLTDYPALTVRPGSTSTISLRLQNYSTAPERFALSVDGAPTGWTATLIGGGQPVAAAMAATNSSVSLQLRVDVPSNAAMGTHTLTVHADSDGNKVSLPIAVTLAKDLPAKLSLEPKLPSLRGSAKSSFEYQITIKNDSGKPLLVSLAAQAPQNFDTSFTEAYGSQELSSIPVEAGTPKDVKLRVRPPATVKAGQYPVTVRVGAEDASAETKVTLDITGQPQLGISGRDGMLSEKAYAGTERAIPIEVTNSGTAPADEVELSGSGPSGWKIVFDPKTITGLAPGQSRDVQALVTPPEKAVAGDYQTTLRANTTRGESASVTFRITLLTSTLWAAVSIGVICVALFILVGAVARFGRR
jgi:uncharacterized membrane protein